MTQEQLKDAFEIALAGYQAEQSTPISVAEATFLRDRIKSLMNLVLEHREELSKQDEAMQALRARVSDAEESAKQLKDLAVRVNDLAASFEARLKSVEERVGSEKRIRVKKSK